MTFDRLVKLFALLLLALLVYSQEQRAGAGRFQFKDGDYAFVVLDTKKGRAYVMRADGARLLGDVNQLRPTTTPAALPSSTGEKPQ